MQPIGLSRYAPGMRRTLRLVIVPLLFSPRATAATPRSNGEGSTDVHVRAIRDRRDSIMPVMTQNTYRGNAFERDGEGPATIGPRSPAGDALGLDILLRAMSG
jgi:hypothetical protein